MLNIVVMQGKLLADVETSKTNDGKDVLTFTIINTREVRDKNGNRGSDFFNVVAWGELARFIANKFHKGDRIVIVGHLQKRLHVGADGTRTKQIEIVAEKAYFSGASAEFLGDFLSEEE